MKLKSGLIKILTPIEKFIISNNLVLNLIFIINNIIAIIHSDFFTLKINHKPLPAKKDKSIAFIGESYYHYSFIAKSLREKGWDAVSISISPTTQFSYEADINIYNEFKSIHRTNYISLLKTLEKYEIIHIYGNLRIWNNFINKIIPLDIVYLKRSGAKIGYTPSGCKDTLTQSEFNFFSKGVCNKCAWQKVPSVCSNTRNANLINKVDMICDYISYEPENTIGIKPWTNKPIFHTEPLFYALSESHWNPDIEIPPKYKIKRKSKDHIILLTAFGNESSRTKDNRDIKGIKASYRAIEALISEGFLLQHHHVSNIPLSDMRYLQAQCDIAIDQLNYGRYGSFARECMMMAKPVLGKIDNFVHRLNNYALNECPIINADENSIYKALKKVVEMTEIERKTLGKKSRSFMIKWHSVDKCIERFERFYPIITGEKIE